MATAWYIPGSLRLCAAIFLTVSLITVALPPRVAQARLVVGHIIVHGQTKTSLGVLSARMDLTPGDIVDFRAIDDAERRLVESDLFTTAHVYIQMPKAEAARRMYVDFWDYPVDVHVEVSDKQSWFVAPIGSFGSGDYAGGIAY